MVHRDARGVRDHGGDDYPNTSRTWMTAIAIQTGSAHPTLSWTATDAVTDTGQHTVVASNANPGGEVDLYYRQGLQSPTVSGHAHVSCVTRSSDHLDVFLTDAGGNILTAAWRAGLPGLVARLVAH